MLSCQCQVHGQWKLNLKDLNMLKLIWFEQLLWPDNPLTTLFNVVMRTRPSKFSVMRTWSQNLMVVWTEVSELSVICDWPETFAVMRTQPERSCVSVRLNICLTYTLSAINYVHFTWLSTAVDVLMTMTKTITNYEFLNLTRGIKVRI